jgi:hypothetical protein
VTVAVTLGVVPVTVALTPRVAGVGKAVARVAVGIAARVAPGVGVVTVAVGVSTAVGAERVGMLSAGALSVGVDRVGTATTGIATVGVVRLEAITGTEATGVTVRLGTTVGVAVDEPADKEALAPDEPLDTVGATVELTVGSAAVGVNAVGGAVGNATETIGKVT